MALKRGWLSAQEVFSYFEAVEETLCFGWVDSVQKLIDGKRMQRFSPRKGNSPWTEFNKARVRRLESLGRMTDARRAVPPIIGPRCFRVDREIEAAMKAARDGRSSGRFRRCTSGCGRKMSHSTRIATWRFIKSPCPSDRGDEAGQDIRRMERLRAAARCLNGEVFFMWKCPKCGQAFSRQNQDNYCVKPETIDVYIAMQDEAVQPRLTG